jgi:hypothetical protein
VRVVAAWLDRGRRGDRRVFRRVAELSGAAPEDIYPVATGAELLELGRHLTGADPVGQLVVAAHGGPDWLLHHRLGVTTHPRSGSGVQVTTSELVRAWSPVLAEEPLISLAACLCSRSPRWWLRAHVGHVASAWGRRSYLPGGEASLSARLRDALHWHGHYARVRGHRAAGHASRLALLAEHSGAAGLRCEPLWQRVHGSLEPTRRRRRRWVGLVTGDLAERWLLGDDEVVGEIRRRWG